MSGISLSEATDNNKAVSVFLPAVFFVLGLSTVFLILGFTASALGTVFLSYQDILITISGLLVMGFGLHFLGILRIGFLEREARFDASSQNGSAFGAYVLGLAFAFGWTPCIGPQLASILTLAASEGSVARGTILLGVYALGLGVPFLLVALFLSRLSATLTWLKRHMQIIERLMGLLLWTIGLMMLTGGFADFSFWILDTFPSLANLG
jgi:cytochrome c-type biogenesis protein